MSFDDQLFAIVKRAVAEGIRDASAPRPLERIPVNDAAQHGAPSARWLRDRARDGLVQLHGPRGGRFVTRADLESLLAKTSLHRTSAPLESGTSIADDVAEMARRRAG